MAVLSFGMEKSGDYLDHRIMEHIERIVPERIKG
jgi:hypothetical protein